MVQVSDQLKRFVNRIRIDCSATENVPDPPNDLIWTPTCQIYYNPSLYEHNSVNEYKYQRNQGNLS